MADAASRAQHYYESLKELADPQLPRELDLYDQSDLSFDSGAARLRSGRTDEIETVRAERSSPQASGVEGQGANGAKGHGLAYLQNTARDRKNVFAALIEAVKTHSLGQISHALYDVGGEYRRNM